MPDTCPTLRRDGDQIVILDQTRLPWRETFVRLDSLDAAAAAIRDMQVRGAPLIGATAAFGIALALRHDGSDAALAAADACLRATRPTAVNLHWALDRMQAALGRAPGSLPEDRRWLRLLDKPARGLVLAAWRRLHRDGHPLHFELAVPAPSVGDASLQLRVWMQPEPEADGRIGRVRGQVQNITEQYQTDALIRWRTELLNRVSALGRIGGCEIEVATRNMLWTEECYRIHGLRKEPITLEQALALYTQDSRDGFEAALVRIADGGLPEQLDLCFYRHSGQRVWVQAQIELDRREGLP